MAQKIKSFLQSVLKSVFFDERRKYFSRTALMNFTFFSFAIFTWIALLVMLVHNYLKTGVLETTFVGVITGYATFITGGGFLQYSYNKAIQKTNTQTSSEPDKPEGVV